MQSPKNQPATMPRLSPTPTSSPEGAAPDLPFELILPILTTAIRSLKPRRTANLANVTLVLNTLSRSAARELSYATIMATPWIDSNYACKVGSTWLLNTLHYHLPRPPYSRPLSYLPSISVSNAVRHGHVDVLQWWFEHMGIRFADVGNYLALATRHEQLHVLEWWMSDDAGPGVSNGGPDSDPINEASNVEMLEWHIAQFGPHLNARHRWIGNSLLRAIRGLVGQDQDGGQQRAIVEWWMGPGASQLDLPKCYYEEAMVCVIMEHGRGCRDMQLALDLLTRLSALWTSAAHKFGGAQPCCQPMDSFATLACYSGDLELIHWCQALLSDKIHESWAYAFASAGGHVHVLEWLRDQGYEYTGFAQEDTEAGITYMPRKMFDSCNRCGFDFLKGHYWSMWGDKYASKPIPEWMANPLSPIEMASAGGHVQVLDWLLRWDVNQFEPNSGMGAINSLMGASAGGHVGVLEWWNAQARVPTQLSFAPLYAATSGGHVAVLDWLLTQGMGSLATMLHLHMDLFIGELVRSIVWGKALDCANQIEVAEWWCNWFVQTPEYPAAAFINELWTSASGAASLELMDHMWRTSAFRPTAIRDVALNHSWQLFQGRRWMLNAFPMMETGRAFEILNWWLEHAPELIAELDLSKIPGGINPMRSGDVLYLEEWFKLRLLPVGMTLDIVYYSAVAALEWASKTHCVRVDRSDSAQKMIVAMAFARRRREPEALEWWDNQRWS